VTNKRILDWVPRFDPRSRKYPIRAKLRSRLPREDRLWYVPTILDQGSEGACVGFGWTAEALNEPYRVMLEKVKADIPRDNHEFASHVYREAQRIDEWEGESYEGTSVLAGAKVMERYGLIKSYRWAFNVDDVIDSIVQKGPVVLGVPWHSGMYRADNGVLKISGKQVGGHCIVAVGYKTSSEKMGGKPSVVLQNSWGYGWGIRGLAEISIPELEKLLKQGEACVPVVRGFGW
jgi:hypothetical protein